MESVLRPLNRVKLTPQEQEMWDTTCTAFLWHCPSFSHVFYNLLDRSGDDYHAVFTDSKHVPVAATDGSAIAFNPKTYFRYNLHNRVFIFCHEVMHCMLDHPRMGRVWAKNGFVVYEDGVKLPYVHKIMGWAKDYVINDILVNANHGQMPLDGLWDRNIGTWQDSCMDVYRKLYKDMKQSGKLKFIKGGSGSPAGGSEPGEGEGDQPDPQDALEGPPGSSQRPFDKELAPGTINGQDEHTAANERNEAEWQTVMETAVQIARLRGTLPASLQHMFGEIKEPHVPWRDHIETLFARRLGSDGYNWRRPNRQLICRDIYAPGRSGHGAHLIVVGADTSGSVGDRELDMFFAELAGIFDDISPEQLVIMWCDAAVHDVDYCDEPSDLNEIRRRGVSGRGGTDFRPVFNKIDELGLSPDCLVYLTDGQGDFPEVEPSYPVIWGNIYPHATYPWGDVVQVPRQAEGF